MKIVVAGRVKDPFFHKARLSAETIAQSNPQLEVEVLDFLSTDWEHYLENKTKEIGGNAIGFSHSPMIYEVNEKGKINFIGNMEDFMNWCRENFKYEEGRPYALALGKSMYKKKLESTKHTFCFFDFAIENGESLGKVIVELYDDVCPKTCENFKRLCEGVEKEGKKYQYKNTPIHRVVPNGWIQGGDIFGGNGNKGGSIYGPVFEDENFIIEHSKEGTLGMANKGEPHSNGSQFYLSLKPNMHWMDRTYVAFGRVIEGMSVIKAIEKLPSNNERPTPECIISDCGIFIP